MLPLVPASHSQKGKRVTGLGRTQNARKSSLRFQRFNVRFRCVSFSKPGAAEDVAQRVVGFVARVLEHQVVGRRPRLLAGPGPYPRLRILDRELIPERLRVDAREALDDVQVLARASEAGLVGEVGRVDDQRVALPPADGVAEPFPDRLRQVLAVHPDDARVVHHLGEDQHGILGLHDLVQVVVEHGQHRRPGRRPEPEQAPLAERTALHVVVGGRSLEAGIVLLRVGGRPRECGRREPLPRLRRHRGDAAVRRIDNHRHALLPVDGEVLGAVVDPEVVVAADVARRAGRPVAAGRRRCAIAAARQRRPRDALGALALEPRRFFLRHHERRPGRPLERRHRRDVVGALKVGMAVRRARTVGRRGPLPPAFGACAPDASAQPRRTRL